MDSSRSPRDGLPGLKENWRSDAVAGFLVFLIAMPLSLAIAKASGFPPIAGIYTAIVGGIVVSLFMGARATIKGPAAGLIAIAVGAVEELGRGDMARGYQLTLAVLVVAAVLQILFGLMKAGKLGDVFPASAVHGMLAAIGIIIIAKQIPTLLGTTAQGKGPLSLLAEVPQLAMNMNPQVAAIGLTSLALLFVLPRFKLPLVSKIPPPVQVLLVAIPMAWYFGFGRTHDYTVGGATFHIVPGNLLVQLPDTLLAGVTFPDFSEILSLVSLKYIVMFSLVGTLESILSAKAIDLLDPFRRQSDLNRDTLAVGGGNLLASLVGGLPMISEIVRSSANINNGGRTRWANFFHGIFLLAFVALAAGVIEMIPTAALAAMLIYTGFRLASPGEFRKAWRIGWDQLAVFVATIVVTLATDLLVGIFSGVLLQFLLHMLAGADVRHFFSSTFEVHEEEDKYDINVRGVAVFSNYLAFKKYLDQFKPGKSIVFNFSEAKIIDHTLWEHLQHFIDHRPSGDGRVIIHGLQNHRAHSKHPLATRVLSA